MAGGFGFTGTRSGMTKKQKNVMVVLLHSILVESTVVDHGDCIGADEDLHRLIIKHRPNILIRIHPPDEKKLRAFCHEKYKTHKIVWVAPPKPYLNRNKDIVNNTNVLVACPSGFSEEQRSGTWSTVRYARKQGRTVFIVFPDGTIRVETGKFDADVQVTRLKKK